MRLLLAEDDLFLADGLSLVLRDSGYVVDVVHTGIDADVALSITSHDLLILDLGLPTLDGKDVLGRQQQYIKDVPFPKHCANHKLVSSD